MSEPGQVQYRVVFGKNDEAVEGSDDAAVVVTIAVADAALDPTAAFMQGRLKASGPTGVLLGVLADGSARAAITRLASRP